MTKAREVPMILANKGFERGTTHLLTELFERQVGLENTVTELALQLTHMAELLSQVVTGATAIRAQVEKLQGKPDDDDLPPMAS